MTPKSILRIPSIVQILVSLSVLVFNEFYLREITKAYQIENSIIVTHLFYIIIILCFTITTLTFTSSLLNNKGARIMLIANGIASTFVLLGLFLLFFFTPFRPPLFILFILICFISLSFHFGRNSNYDLID